jgi:hypothetical protein
MRETSPIFALGHAVGKNCCMVFFHEGKYPADLLNVVGKFLWAQRGIQHTGINKCAALCTVSVEF